MPNETITITKEEFRNAAVDLTTKNEHISKICKDIPIMMMSFLMFAGELEKKLFEESEEN